MNKTFVFFVVVLLLLLSFLHFQSKPETIHEHFESESQSLTADDILSAEQVNDVKNFLSDTTFESLVKENNGDKKSVLDDGILAALIENTNSDLVNSLKTYFKQLLNATINLYEEKVKGNNANILRSRIVDLVNSFKKYRDTKNIYFNIFDSILKKIKEKNYFTDLFEFEISNFLEDRITDLNDGDQESEELQLPSQVLRFSQKPLILSKQLVYDINAEYINIMPDTDESNQMKLRVIVLGSQNYYQNKLAEKIKTLAPIKFIRNLLENLERNSLKQQEDGNIIFDGSKISEQTKQINDAIENIPNLIQASLQESI